MLHKQEKIDYQNQNGHLMEMTVLLLCRIIGDYFALVGKVKILSFVTFDL